MDASPKLLKIRVKEKTSRYSGSNLSLKGDLANQAVRLSTIKAAATPFKNQENNVFQPGNAKTLNLNSQMKNKLKKITVGTTTIEEYKGSRSTLTLKLGKRLLKTSTRLKPTV